MSLTLRTLVPLVGLFLGLVGCASSSSSQGEKLRVTLRDFSAEASGGKATSFELVSESHTDRIEYYSSAREDATRKIQTDEVLAALLSEMDRNGLNDHLEAGPGPTSGRGVVTRVLEIQRRGRTYHFAVGKGSEIEARQAFNACLSPFLQLYSMTSGFQSVQGERSREFIRDTQEQSGRGKRPQR